MATLYFLAIIPIIIGGILWAMSKQVNWLEWAGGSAAAFAVAGMFHLIGVNTIGSDTQTFSGQISEAKHFTAWQEYYEEAIYKTVTKTRGSGKNKTTYTERVFSHWESRRRWHSEKFVFYSNINTEYTVSESAYREIVRLFKDENQIAGDRSTMEHNSRMIGGDKYDRVSHPVSGFVYPVTDTRTWTNRIKAGPSVYTFVKVPKDVKVFDWPANPDPFVSQRLLGTAANAVSTYDWDKMNAYLGPLKKVNVIAIGFGDADSEIAQYQRAKYIGGKKNDVVICYGGDNTKPRWVVVFGWTDAELVKQNLQTLILENGFTPKILPEIQKEIVANYKIKDWSSFDHIAIPVTTSLLVWYIIISGGIQVGLYIWFHRNEYESGGVTRRFRPRY